jgi:hypothetical protein
VRINLEELHFNDIAFADKIYAAGGHKRDKQVHFLNFVTVPIASSVFTTVDHDHHRIRRSATNKFFSRAQISKLESVVKGLVDKLCDKMIRLSRSSLMQKSPNSILTVKSNQNRAPLDVTTAYSCFTSDVISGYCFGEPFGFV